MTLDVHVLIDGWLLFGNRDIQEFHTDRDLYLGGDSWASCSIKTFWMASCHCVCPQALWEEGEGTPNDGDGNSDFDICKCVWPMILREMPRLIPGAACQRLAKVYKKHGYEEAESYTEGSDIRLRVG